VGWLVNTVIGIALWMLPLNRARFPRTQGRYPRRMVAACFTLLNGGLVLRLVGEPWYQLGGETASPLRCFSCRPSRSRSALRSSSSSRGSAFARPRCRARAR